MKTFRILEYIEKQGLDNLKFQTFSYSTPGTNIDFVKRYFGGDFVAGYLNRGYNYIAFWEDAPNSVADAIVTDNEGQRIYIYHCE